MWPGLIKSTAATTAEMYGEGKPYDKNELKARIVKEICSILDPNQNPQRGDINDEIFYSNENGHDKHVYSEEWAKYVLVNEIIPWISKNEEIESIFSGNEDAVKFRKRLIDLAKRHLGISWITGEPI